MSSTAATRRWAVLVVGTASGLLVLSGPAEAHHVELLATADCSGTVAYAVTSWAGVPNTPRAPRANALSRTTSSLLVQLSRDGGPFLTVRGPVRLDEANGFASAGTLSLPDGPLPATLQLRTVTTAPYANGAQGGPRVGRAIDLRRCQGRRETLGAPSPAPASVALPTRRRKGQEGVLAGGLLGALGTWWATRRPGGAR